MTDANILFCVFASLEMTDANILSCVGVSLEMTWL